MPELRISNRALWRNLSQLIQIGFSADCITLIESSGGMKKVTTRALGRDLLQLYTYRLEAAPISTLRRAGAQSNPSLRKFWKQLDGFSPLNFRLTSVSLNQVGHPKLVVPNWISGIAFDRLLQSLEGVVELSILKQDLALQDESLGILR